MSEIAKASGVTKSLIHHHFGSKDALWGSVKRRCFEAYHQQQVQLLAGRPLTPETAKASMRIYYEFLRDNPQVLRLMWWMLLDGDDDRSNELVAELGDLGVQQIQGLQDQGVIRSDLKPESILSGFLGLIHAAFTEGWMIERRNITPDGYVDEAWEMFASAVFVDRR